MKSMMYTLAVLGMVGLTSTAVLADDHMDGDHKAKMMERIDTNNDGMISKSEFMTKHEEKFTMMDTNKDGMLSMEEMEAAKKKMKEKWGDKKEKRMNNAE